ncbi:MAG: fibronectin type III domain-containing protein, partial [Acidobacteria bacterium]|nr:fibronectin type III domain-containing protein [Acidobacteriota bacterium]
MTKSRLSPTRVGALALVLAAAVAGTGTWLGAAAAPPTLNPAVVLGPNVTLSWTAVAGATSYRVAAGLTPGATDYTTNVGNLTSVGVAAPAVGTYYVRVFATDVTGESVASNEEPIVVSSLFVPPAAPTNLTAYVNGTTALITWELGTGGGAPNGLYLFAGTTPGGSEVGVFPLGVGTQVAVPNVGASTYYLRLAASNQGGQSPESNEAVLEMPAGGGCSAPPARTFSSAVFGRYVQLAWTPVPGASGYRLDFATSPGGPITLSQGVPANQSGLSASSVPLGVYYGTLTTGFSCGQESTGPETAITVDGAPPPGPRTPNPAPGQRLSLPNMSSVVNQLANERRDLLQQSCVEHGGNNRFVFELVRRLRAIDNRWGLNWKRGNRGDMSQDIVNYNYGSESDEDTINVYIIDTIGGHCGSNPGPSWIDQTEAT